MRRSFALLIVAAVTTGFMTNAGALVPIGVITYEDHARAQAAEAATLAASPGRGLVIASYTLAPGTDSGWKDHTGPAVVAVTSGTLVLHSAAGCATKAYTAGQAAVLPAGRHRLSNPGDQPLAFSGAFLDGAADEITPFLDAGEAPRPTACVAADGETLRTTPSAASVVRSSRGTFVGLDAYQQSAHAHHARGIEVEAGKDILVTSYHGGPYASAGWLTHLPSFEIVTTGTLTNYEGRDGHCVKAGEFTAGQAYVHAAPVTHMPVNEGPGVVEETVIYFNLPHNARPIPVVGNQTDAVNFGALPPADCPKVR